MPFFGFLLFFTVTTSYYCKNKGPEVEYIAIEPIAVNEHGKGYAGSSVCLQCHREIAESHWQTAHFKSSAISDSSNVMGSFNKGENHYDLNEHIAFRMVKKQGNMFQEAFTKKDGQNIYSLKFDMTIGSGNKGQSYLSWMGNGLYQQQISYYAPTDRWINSPMYPKGRFVKPRPVVQKCIGCHATFAETFSNHPQDNRYKKNQMVLGIDCERCHGPAAKHVDYHRDHPEIKDAFDIGKFSNLNRQQRLDACALCHSGLDEKTTNGALKFDFGDVLVHANTGVPDDAELDVHGNQYGLLTQSECFKKSEKMDCTTCHNPHKNERGDSVKFNAICIGCHSSGKKECAKKKNPLDRDDCIKCHMPVSPSKSMSINSGVNDSITPLYVRTHLIKSY